MSRLAAEKRVLAVQPTTRGFGFVVLEGPERLVDWALVRVRSDKEPQLLARVSELVGRYSPDVLVIEDGERPDSRRRARVKRLLRLIAKHNSSRSVRLRRYSRRQVRRLFSQRGALAKPEIATLIAEQFPELRSRVPPRRKIGMGQDERMGIFDAAAFAMTHFSLLRQEDNLPGSVDSG